MVEVRQEGNLQHLLIPRNLFARGNNRRYRDGRGGVWQAASSLEITAYERCMRCDSGSRGNTHSAYVDSIALHVFPGLFPPSYAYT